MAKQLMPFDPAEYLDDADSMAAYLQDAIEDDTSEFLEALSVVARAKGMTEVARSAGVTRPALYRSLSRAGRPDLHTIVRVLKSLGLELRLLPTGTKATPPRSKPMQRRPATA